MSSPTTSEFRELFPAFCQTVDAQIAPWFTQAALRFRSARFGTQWHMAVYLFTAHHLTVNGVPGNPASGGVAADASAHGAVTSERIGDLAKSYGAAVELSKVPASLQHFARTQYGVELIGLILSRAHTRGRVVRTGYSRVGAVAGVEGS